MRPTTLNRSQKAAFVTPVRILVATDLTDGEYLLPHAAAQAKACGARVLLVHAVLPANSAPIDAGYIPYSDCERVNIDRHVQLELQGMARQLEAQGISCDVFFKHGFASEVIAEKLESSGATRLIMGSHGRGKLGQFMLGSVANELLGTVNAPIFIVGPQTSPADHRETPRKILHPVSLIGDYRRSAEIAIDLARLYKAELTLFHVLDPDVENAVNPERSLNWAENALLALVASGKDLAHPVQTRAMCGKVLEGILKAATQTNADWIVLGVDGGFNYLPFSNSYAYKLIAAVKCPVLTVRHEPQLLDDEKPVEDGHLSCIAN